ESVTDDYCGLFESFKDFECIIIFNKTKLEQRLDLNKVKELSGEQSIVTTSLLKEEGIDQLEVKISETFFDGELDSGDLTYVSNVRHIQLLNQAKDALKDAMEGLEMQMPLDIIQ